MNPPTYDEISARAYQLWEARGRPMDDDVSLECWIQAERELREASDDSDEKSLPPVELTNLDRALSPEARQRARAARQTNTPQARQPDEAGHFVVVLNRAQLRIYQEERAEEGVGGPLHLAESFDLPAGKQNYTDRDTDQAGRFSGGKGRQSAGGSIDERLPMLEEHQRRTASELSTRIEAFLQKHPRASWDFAAGPALHHAVLDALTPPVRQRLRQAIHKDVVKQPLPELRARFEEELSARD